MCSEKLKPGTNDQSMSLNQGISAATTFTFLPCYRPFVMRVSASPCHMCCASHPVQFCPSPRTRSILGGCQAPLTLTQSLSHHANASSGKPNSSSQQTESGPNSAPAVDKSFHVFLGYKNTTEKYLK